MISQTLGYYGSILKEDVKQVDTVVITKRVHGVSN